MIERSACSANRGNVQYLSARSFAAIALCFAAAGAAAQEQPGTRASRLSADRYSVTLGAYSVHARTSMRLDAAGGRVGTTIDFENTLGLNSETVVRDLGLGVRFGTRHRLELERFAFDRTGSRTSTRRLRVGSDTYDVGLQLNADLDTDVTRLGYAYSFVRRDDRELGLHVGLHVTDITMRIRVAFLPLSSETQEFAEASAPLPVVGLQGAYRFLPKWTLHGRAQVFRLAAGDYEGELDHAALSIEHDTFRHFGLGLGIDFFEVDLDSTDGRFLGAFNLQFSGPRFYAHAHF